MMRLIPFFAATLLITSACDDPKSDDALDQNDSHDHVEELKSGLVLTFTPQGRGDTVSVGWSPSDGNEDTIAGDILLPDASNHNHHDTKSYTLDIAFWNDEVDPAEETTSEIADLAEEYQIFFTGSAVEGPATGTNRGAIIEHAYDDSDADGLPLGLSNSITTLDWGAGELTVTLRHLPLEDGEPTKTDGLAEDVASGGFSAISGESDIQVTFNIEVE